MPRRPLRLLSVVPFPPRLDATDGGGRATANLLVRLAARNRVALVHPQRPGEAGADPALLELCERVEAVSPDAPSRNPALRRAHKALLLARGEPLWAIDVAACNLAPAVAAVAAEWRPDIVQVEYAVAAAATARLPGTIPRILVDHDPGRARAEEAVGAGAGLPTRLLRRADLFAWQRFERRNLRASMATIVFTEADRLSLARSAPEADVRVIPLGIDLPVEPLDPLGSEEAIVFVGNFIHPPNADAALHLLRDILPRVRLRHPGLKTYVVGDQPPPELRPFALEGVVVTGRVDRVEPYLDRAALAVAPLRTGGGMRMKVLETLAAGKALVATPRAVAGLSVRDREHVFLAEGADAFADAIASLLAEPGRRGELARNARAWARQQHDWESVTLEYERVYASLLPGCCGGRRELGPFGDCSSQSGASSTMAKP